MLLERMMHELRMQAYMQAFDLQLRVEIPTESWDDVAGDEV